MYQKVCIIFLFLVILAECGRVTSRRNYKKEMKSENSVRVRGDVFENMFSIYDPSFLSSVWPKIKNGVHITLSDTCYTNLSELYADLAKGRLWAYMVTDSSGRYQPGVFAGQGFWLGSRKQCFDMDKNLMEAMQSNDLVEYDWTIGSDVIGLNPLVEESRPKFRLAYSVAKVYVTVVTTNFAKQFDLTIGLCLPRSCDRDDIASVLTFSVMLVDHIKSNRSTSRVVKMSALREIESYYNFYEDLGALILLGITLTLTATAVIATIMDIKQFKCKRVSKSVTLDLQKYNKTDVNRFLESKNVEANVCNDVPAMASYSNVSLVAVKDVASNPAPPVTLDVASAERATGSCHRCGKYRKQCKNPKQGNFPPCPRVKYSSEASLPTTVTRCRLFQRLVLCFSIKYCLIRLFNTNVANKNMAAMHVLKIVATLWVIFIHVAVIVSYATVNTFSIHNHDNMYYVLATGTLAFDTLFFVSGIFSSHHYFYLRSRYTVEELVSFSGFFGQILQYVCFVTNRAIRLLPSYMYAIFLSGVIARVSWSTSAVTLPDGDRVNCDRHWWRNLLYVTTLYASEEECMQISWYLSTESQLHVVGALLCALGTGRRGRVVASLLLTALLATTAADVTGAYRDYVYRMPGVFAAYSTIINRPWARVVPYFTGVIAGWLLYKTDGILNVSRMTWWWVWLATLAALALSCALPWLRAARGWAAAGLHLTWPAALLWPSLLAATKYKGTSRRLLNNCVTASLSRLCYSALLLHAPLARLALLRGDAPLCADTMCVWSYFAGTTLLTLFASLLLVVLVEIPFCCILRRLSDCANK